MTSTAPHLDDPGRSTRRAVDAATVVVVRDHHEGLQVLMQERALASDFVGGAWVFPGGKVDPRDHGLAADRVDGSGATAARRLGARSTGLAQALLVAAIRETFEEAGILLATRDGRLVSPDDLATPAFVDARRQLAERGQDHDWRAFLAEQDLVLSLDALRPLAWWITPHGVHRRFSTRFFLTAVPDSQDAPARHDDVEMTGTVWTTPRAALDAAAAGDRMVILPTRRVLASLDGHDDVATVLDRADRGGFDLRPILPLVRSGADGLQVQHPDGGPSVAV